MHVCFLSLDYPSAEGGGGVGSQVRSLGRVLAAEGHRITVVALAGRRLPESEEDNGIRLYRVKPGNLHWYISRIPMLGGWLALSLRELEYALAIWRRVRQLHAAEPFDVIEGTETGALLVALWRKAPLLIRLHGDEFTFRKYTPDIPLTFGVRLSRAIQRMALRRARLLISPSRAHAAEIANELGRRHPPIEIVPNAVPLGIETEPTVESAAPGGGESIVLYVGRLQRSKGIPALLEAARAVLAELPGVQFVLAGGPHPTLPAAELTRMTERLSLKDNLRNLGHLTHQQLARFYQAAAVAALPSYYETFGIAALEAQACGVPVVAFRCGALPEVVEDGVTGILTPPGDNKAFADAILRLLRDSELRRRMGTAGRRRAEDLYDIRRHVSATLKLYEQAVTRHSKFAVDATACT